jgi:hypothetical protein
VLCHAKICDIVAKMNERGFVCQGLRIANEAKIEGSGYNKELRHLKDYKGSKSNEEC